MPAQVLLVLLLSIVVSGCTVVAVADAAVSVAATGVKVAARTTGAVVDAAIPDGENEEPD